MRLSEAIIQGSKLRPVTVLDRFVNVEGKGLCSDVWGAACEAVQPAVASFNWNRLDVFKFERSMDALRAVQEHYFKAYFKMPARCPGAKRVLQKTGGRLIHRFGHEPEVKTYDDYAKLMAVPGITTECQLVQQLAGLVDHLFYKHRMSREDVAKCVEEYENAREAGIQQQVAVNRNFNHYTPNWRWQ